MSNRSRSGTDVPASQPAALPPGARALASAARALAHVIHDGRNADEALAFAQASDDRAAVRAIALGTMRWYLRLRPAVNALLSRQPKSMDPVLHALLICAAHQIVYSRNAPEGVVDAAVDAARSLGPERATGFINAVLRRFVRERHELLAAQDRDLATRHAHPRWFVDTLRREEPVRLAGLLEANNLPAPMTLRVALDRIDRETCLAQLAAAGIGASALGHPLSAVRLEEPVGVESLPGFRDGLVSVQDAGAQFAAWLLDAQPGMRVLDACAAPGGKTGHILEAARGDIDLLAIDSDADRLVRVRENLERLQRRARVRQADLRSREALDDEAPFDRILIDAPCSSTGVIRRHPDIKLLRRAADIPPLARLQRQILENCYARLAPGGRLVYCTCSVLPAENAGVVSAFLEDHPDARVAGPPGDGTWPVPVEARGPGFQLFPAPQAPTDGFHYACLTKAASKEAA